MKRPTIPLTLDHPLHRRIIKAAERTGLKRSDVMRLSISRGLDVLVAQLESAKPTTQ